MYLTRGKRIIRDEMLRSSNPLSQVKHDVLLEAKFDPASSRLALLLTHAPVELSSRVLCYFSLHRIDNVMDTGDVQFYDEMVSRNNR